MRAKWSSPCSRTPVDVRLAIQALRLVLVVLLGGAHTVHAQAAGEESGTRANERATANTLGGASGGVIRTDSVRIVGASLRSAIKTVEVATGYRFLFRDALIANRVVSFAAHRDAAIDSLVAAAAQQGIAASVDMRRRQVLLFSSESRDSAQSGADDGAEGSVAISGSVLDAQSGEPLPYATVSWEASYGLAGVVSDEHGRVAVPRNGPMNDSSLVRFSYVGYTPVIVRRDELSGGFGIRLSAREDLVSEVVVSAVPLEAEVDSVWGRAVMSSDLSTFGADNAIRALQALPAVSISGAMSGGTIVRGSRPDGFQVLLDGIPVYSPTHFFGLFDAFNADALTAVGLYYAVSPAELAGPPGGTISFITRGGSRQRLSQRVGLSSTSATATVEGPLGQGSGSWLVSFRRSLLDVLDWFGNKELIGVGLDIDRETSAPPVVSQLNERVVRPGESEALFYDLHAKAVFDGSDSGRWQLSTYFGGDRTAQEAERFAAVPGDSLRRVTLEDVSTSNDWRNRLFGLQRQGSLAGGFYTINASVSGYRSEFFKGDYPFVRRQDAAPILAELVVDTLESNNTLDDVGLSAKLTKQLSARTTLAFGVDAHSYSVAYDEIAAGFARTRSLVTDAWLLDSYVSSTVNWKNVAALIGLRGHYFWADDKLRLSPRLRLSRRIGNGSSVFVGYSRSHQFLHQLFLDYTTDARIWALSTDAEPPGTADHLTVGLRSAAGHIAIQVEAYYKRSTGIRQHETAVARRIRDFGLALSPWVHDFEGLSRGFETMFRVSSGQLRLSAGYTLSQADLRHGVATDGEWVPADWDRRHQVVLTSEVALPARLTATVQWLYGSGSPNTLEVLDPREPDRLGGYHRMDVSVGKRFVAGDATIRLLFTVYNVYDQQNPWYRTAVAVLDGPLNNLRLRTTAVDVYDLGFRPAFSLSVRH